MSQLSFETEVQTLSGETKDLSEYRGKVLLVVNTASKCGLTPQFKGLERLYQDHKDEGLVVLGFPSNGFAQELGDAEAISEVCHINYGVTFPMHAKVEVNGSGTHPLFAELKRGARGALGTEMVKWNFTKFLVGRDGRIVKRVGPRTPPRDIDADIRYLLSE